MYCIIAPSSHQVGPKCPKSHGLQRILDVSPFRFCDICQQRNCGTWLHCHFCDYDVCPQCENSQRSMNFHVPQGNKSSSREELKCPKSHGLQRFLDINPCRFCDICQQRNFGKWLHCHYCDYDVCPQCESSQRTKTFNVLQKVSHNLTSQIPVCQTPQGTTSLSKEGLKCPKSHILQRLLDNNPSRECDVCKLRNCGKWLHCHNCDYDVCPQCEASQRNKNFHILQRSFDSNPNRTCDVCGHSIYGSWLHCQHCDYDVCKKCENPEESKLYDTGRPTSKRGMYLSNLSDSKTKHPTSMNDLFSKTQQPQQQKVDPKKITFLLLGPSGAGKTSLINFFFIWSKKLQIESLSNLNRLPIKNSTFDGDDTAEKNIYNQKESCTQTSQTYSFPVENSTLQLQFIDTPGLGDTRGIAQDEKNILDICQKVQDIPDLRGIILVLNGSETRFDSRMQYIIKKLEGLIPDNLRANLFVLLTHTNSKPNISMSLFRPLGIKDDRVFTFNNQLFLLSREELKSDKTLKRLSSSFDDCIEVLDKIFVATVNCEPKLTSEFKEMLENRTKLSEYSKLFYDTALLKQKVQNDLCERIANEKNSRYQDNVFLNSNNSLNQENSAIYREFVLARKGKTGIFYCNNKVLSCTCCDQSHEPTNGYYCSACKWILENGKDQGPIHLSKLDGSNKLAILKKQKKSELEIVADEIYTIIANIKKICSNFDLVTELEKAISVLDEEIMVLTAEKSVKLSKFDEKSLLQLKQERKKMQDLYQALNNK